MNKFRILHLTNDYFGSMVYKNLFKNIGYNKFIQTVLIIIRTDQKKLISNSIINKYKLENSEIRILFLNFFQSLFFRFFIFLRGIFLSGMIVRNNFLNSSSLVHAHTLFSNGSIAYALSKKNNLKYIVAVRNVDVNYILKYYPWQRAYAKRILLNAKHIVFISPSLRNNLLNIINSESISKKIKLKSSVIPNGIDKFWIDNAKKSNNKNFKRKINLIFVGEINPNKSIDLIIDSFIKIKSMYDKASLKVVGSNKPGFHKRYTNNIINKCKSLKGVEYFRHINNKLELLNLYRKSDIFIMPSKYETFGLVYIEAMSQGLPIIYTKNQGVDGFFKQGQVGYSVRLIEDDIVKSVKKILKNYNQISFNCYNESKNFSWENISNKYEKIYSDIL